MRRKVIKGTDVKKTGTNLNKRCTTYVKLQQILRSLYASFTNCFHSIYFYVIIIFFFFFIIFFLSCALTASHPVLSHLLYPGGTRAIDLEVKIKSAINM